MKHKVIYNSPIGLLEITASQDDITEIKFVEQGGANKTSDVPILNQCLIQLNEYFNQQRQQFDLKLNPSGTLFQKQVWNELQNIPYGRTVSYAEVARKVGNSNSVRAIGKANNSNPIVIVIPCHRVIGADGKLVGYGGGLWRKEWLLRHEGALII